MDSGSQVRALALPVILNLHPAGWMGKKESNLTTDAAAAH